MALGQYLVWRSQCTDCFLTFKEKKKAKKIHNITMDILFLEGGAKKRLIGGADKSELIEAAAVILELALMLGPCINANSSDHLTTA